MTLLSIFIKSTWRATRTIGSNQQHVYIYRIEMDRGYRALFDATFRLCYSLQEKQRKFSGRIHEISVTNAP